LHTVLLPDAPQEAFLVENLLRVLAHNLWRRQFVVPLGFQVRLICGLRGTIKTLTTLIGAPLPKLHRSPTFSCFVVTAEAVMLD